VCGVNYAAPTLTFADVLSCLLRSDNYGEAGHSMLARTNTPVLGIVYIWKLHLRECARQLEAALEDAMQMGDFEW
jgi:hypothetical protein